ncbi:hypothetical protein B4119_3723 [Parageobacillus caldoxylosilyticus]|uniref:Uncharacterized protein n=1 Tax=Saccharococcus caldoxylosilyticus TaxID=81408 RepID=A0A150LG64_9BACL|nr:hypothetical protein B4119_3723 [Parageobacillus caldoxylosilyticus]
MVCETIIRGEACLIVERIGREGSSKEERQKSKWTIFIIFF